ncbi:HD domain-containing phosphohydrolase [Vibrio sonorensis]|uniref:HD domain-containing phosphohydrolase n=1 Tax=Vibrio sonorensis TaxID=1004316 RepID=UPI0008D92DB2|nr:HD domain-containing phosphohydrolase [Vibrio sonorensis]
MDGLSVKAKKFSIRFTVGSLFLIATTVTAVIAIALQYYFAKQASEEQVVAKLTLSSADVSEHIQKIEVSASSSARILKAVSVATQHRFSANEIRGILTEVLADNPMFYSIYYGKANEDFYQVINLESSPIVREKITAGANDRWVIIEIFGDRENRQQVTSYLTKDFKLTKQKKQESNYYPTQRPWFGAATSSKVYKTDPYLFKHLKITGQTYSIKGKNAVLGVDIVLSSVNSKLSAKSLGLTGREGVESYLFNAHGEVIASNQLAASDIAIPPSHSLALTQEEKQWLANTRPLLISNQMDWSPFDYASAGEPKGYAVDMLKLVSTMTGLELEFVNGFTWPELSSKYRLGDVDLIHSVSSYSTLPGMTSVPMFSDQIAVAVIGDKPLPTALLQLNQKKIGLVEGQGFEKLLNQQGVNADVVRFSNLELAFKALHRGDIEVLLNTLLPLQSVDSTNALGDLKIGYLTDQTPMTFHLAAKQKDSRLVAIINRALNNISLDQRQALTRKWLSTSALRGSYVPYSAMLDIARMPELHGSMVKRLVDGKPRYFYVTAVGEPEVAKEFLAVVVPEALVTDQVVEQLWKALAITVIAMVLLLPLAWRFGSPIVTPILSLIEETRKIKARQYDKVRLVDTRIKEIHQLSASMVDMAREIQKRAQSQEEFIESFIRLIAQAIDDKSPYTAGHCNRVPELGLMLAEVLEKSEDEKFKDFMFNNDNERREFRIAAWLHDCGKITTPEHIVDKGTKLEANYNRIHEIRTRFEVLWRDAEIQYLKGRLSGETDKQTGLNELARAKAKLKEEFEFVAQANVGSEFMDEEQVARIKAIANQTWVRHFDDRLGLSPLEEMNHMRGEQTLPAVEPLLIDRAEHVIRRERPVHFDEQYGIKVDVPEHMYNLGEIYNLCIRRGTLTPEDRYKINEHMISGIKMLEALPFPPELSRVPRYASTHHETLKGTGYPRKLTGDQLSVPERILVVADIFEALTAADRPYKKAKPLSVAVDIMYKMALDQHVDKDIFLIFLQSGTYLEYARKFLPRGQIDEVDIEKYLRGVKAA